jgi:CDP-diacylglycerol--serine O-phosphatidyltransferase
MQLKKHIPNLFTLSNLVCGSLSVINLAGGGDPAMSGWLIFIAAFFDLLDGAIARALGVSDELGKQLDSLADVVSFGLAPSVIAMHLMETFLPSALAPLKYIAILNVCAAAIRLARFNISTDQKHDFSGMPSPANGIFWASIILAFDWLTQNVLLESEFSTQSTYFILFKEASKISFAIAFLVMLSSWLMIARIRMFSFKLQPGGFGANKIPYIFIGVMVITASIFGITYQSVIPAIPVILIEYILLSFFYHFQQKSV